MNTLKFHIITETFQLICDFIKAPKFIAGFYLKVSLSEMEVISQNLCNAIKTKEGLQYF